MRGDRFVAGSVDEYVAQFPADVKAKLESIRATIRKAAPKAEEVISYMMPAYRQQGMLVYFAGFKNHIGFFPGADGVASFKNELKDYKTSKGTIQFPLDKPVPLKLVTMIVKFRVAQNMEKALAKAKPKKKSAKR